MNEKASLPKKSKEKAAIVQYNNNKKVSEPTIGYVGETKGGQRHGFGKYVYPNRLFWYEGQWEKGQKHGKGKLCMNDGSFYEGDFVDGEIEGEGRRYCHMTGNLYEGQFVCGEKNGYGIMRYADGSEYIGNWKLNQYEGRGLLRCSDGSKYDGLFREHKREGKGTYTYSNGDVYIGNWAGGERHGQGKFTSANGDLNYDGSWYCGLFNGNGRVETKSGYVYDGLWVGGYPENEVAQLQSIGVNKIIFDPGSLNPELAIDIQCVDELGSPITEESGRVLQLTAGVRWNSKLWQGSQPADLLSTPFGFSVIPFDVKRCLNVAHCDPESSQSESIKPRKISASLSGLDDVEKEKKHRAGAGAADPQAVKQQKVKAASVKERSIEKLTPEDIHSYLQSLMPVESVTTVRGRVSFSGLILPAAAKNSPGGGGGGGGGDDDDEFPPSQAAAAAAAAAALSDDERETKTTKLTKKMVGGAAGGGKGKHQTTTRGSMIDAAATIAVRRKAARAVIASKKPTEAPATARFCTPGDYVLIVSDVTQPWPTFLDSRPSPAFIHVVVPKPKKQLSHNGTSMSLRPQTKSRKC